MKKKIYIIKFSKYSLISDWLHLALVYNRLEWKAFCTDELQN